MFLMLVDEGNPGVSNPTKLSLQAHPPTSNTVAVHRDHNHEEDISFNPVELLALSIT